jgi:hypothetical protein
MAVVYKMFSRLDAKNNFLKKKRLALKNKKLTEQRWMKSANTKVMTLTRRTMMQLSMLMALDLLLRKMTMKILTHT